MLTLSVAAYGEPGHYFDGPEAIQGRDAECNPVLEPSFPFPPKVLSKAYIEIQCSAIRCCIACM